MHRANKPGNFYAILKRARVRGNTNLLLLTKAMKSPVNAPLSVPRDMDTAGLLSLLYSQINTLNGQYIFLTFLMLT
jgi:hypothetical protein